MQAKLSKSKATLKIGVVAAIIFLLGLMTPRHLIYPDMATKAIEATMVMEWEGFGPERGVYNFTVVTALLDIGRGEWKTRQQRTYNTYLLYMQRMLRLDVNMVVFVEAKGRPFIEWMRRGREARTKIIMTKFTDVPYYKLRGRIQEIMLSDEYRLDNELVEGKKCESMVPEYDILQLSKFHFLERAIDMNPFKTDYFVWLDAGYSKGKNVFPVDGIWIPKIMMDHPHQLTFMERDSGLEFYRNKQHLLHKRSVNIIAGLFFGGGKDAFREAFRLQKEQVAQWMSQGVIDDDQTMYMLLYYKKPSLFNLVKGSWNDVFKIFGKMPTNDQTRSINY